MANHRPLLIVLAVGIAAIAVGVSNTPLWDEDEPRFAAIARAMVETGDWIVPRFNGEIAVDKPVFMHWCMAACMSVFGINEFAARLPSMLAALATALAVLRFGTRFFDPVVGMIAALAWLGTILAGIEAHAATPDAILTALCTWATVLAAEGLAWRAAESKTGEMAATGETVLSRLSIGRAAMIGLLLGLAVVCKGPIGFVGPLAVLVPWAWWVAVDRRVTAMHTGTWFQKTRSAALPAVVDVLTSTRPFVVTLTAIAAAAPWYVAVWLRTDGAWIEGFFFVHNVGRFMAPMEKHGGGAWYHPVTMLVCFYPWSCFLPVALVLATWRTWRRALPDTLVPAVGLILFWFAVWVGGFSVAATKLPNYVLPAYPAAAIIVAWVSVDAARRAAATGHWPHLRWVVFGLGSLVFGGLATAATVLVASRFGAPGGEPAALVGIIPIIGAIICWRLAATGKPVPAVYAFAGTALLYTSLAVGPGSMIVARANTIPAFVQSLDAAGKEPARIGTFTIASPNIVFYAEGRVHQIVRDDAKAAAAFLASGPDAVLLVPEQKLSMLEGKLPSGYGVIGRTRPLFRPHDVVAIGRVPPSDRTARSKESLR
jgi:4-amino-4-deoxy-L-arabinose transferase-like glycosyltransferase